MVPTSLPGGRPRGMVRVRPRMPREAMWSRFGVRATSSGVLPPSSGIGSSAIPSPCSTTTFIESPTLTNLEHCGQPGRIGGDLDRGLRVGDRRVGVLQAMAGKREHENVLRAETSARAELERPRERDGRRGLGEDTLGAGEQAVRLENLVVGD